MRYTQRLIACGTVATAVLALLFAIETSPVAAAPPSKPITVRIDTSKSVARFTPEEAFGGGLDGLGHGEVVRTYRPSNLATMAEAPFHRISYRLRTELGVHVWHWNTEGAWSDAKNSQGYWISSDKPGAPLTLTHGYSLPRRGNTHDQAANNGYSRLVDGDETSFWKTNPYLDKHFTGEENDHHPQWLVIDFGAVQSEIQAVRILWGEPFAERYEVQYWDGEATEYFNDLRNGVWRPFPQGRIDNGSGGVVTLQLSDTPVRLRYMRIMLQRSSGRISAPSDDVRDRLGFAIRELYAGVLGADGTLNDEICHGTSASAQTNLITSSTDPWHRATDLDPGLEQPGIDLVMASPLTRGRPVLMPTGLIYDTPENAAAQIRYMKARGYKFTQIELGEEPDGQNVVPEHYGALFIQFARVIHEVDPTLATGGPGFQSEVDGWNTMIDASGNHSWMNRFIAYLKARGRLGDFGFFTFEWYPFDNMCHPASAQLMSHPGIIRHVLKRLDADGVPRNIPWIISEYGYSSFAGQSEVEPQAALLNAEIVAQFLQAGVKTAYLYGIEPNVPINDRVMCDSWGNLMLFQVDDSGEVKWRLPAFHGAALLVKQWAGAANKPHDMYKTTVGDGRDGQAVAAYTLRRPDGRWATLLLNKSDKAAQSVRLEFDGLAGGRRPWTGRLDLFQYSAKQYQWQADGAKGRPMRSEPPEYRRLRPRSGPIMLPPMSLTLIRGAMPAQELVDRRFD